MGPTPGTSQNTSPFTRDAKTKSSPVQGSKWAYDTGKARSRPQVKHPSTLPDLGTHSFLSSCLQSKGMTVGSTANNNDRTDEDSK